MKARYVHETIIKKCKNNNLLRDNKIAQPNNMLTTQLFN